MRRETISLVFLILLFFAFEHSPYASYSRRDAAYLCGIDGTCMLDSTIYQRYELLMGFSECPQGANYIKSHNPNILLFLYTSGTDNYTHPSGITSGSYFGSREHAWLKQRCVQNSFTPEILYLHLYDNTVISGVSIPGIYSTALSAKDSVSRCADYLSYYYGSGVGRILVNFANPYTRRFEIEYACLAFDTLAGSYWPGKNYYWDGYYLDNWSWNWGQTGYGALGSVSSGGKVVETHTNPDSMLIYGSTAFRDWYWSKMKLFAQALRDTLSKGASWTPDRKRKYLAINTGVSWSDDYTHPNVSGADYLNMEFLYSPLENYNASSFNLENTARRDSVCAANGVRMVYCAREVVKDDNAQGSISYSQSIYDILCWYYVARSESTYVFMRPGFGGAYGALLNPSWDSLTWCNAMNYDLGVPMEHYTLKQTGTDPKGYSYKIYQRRYARGLVLSRPRGAWGEGFDDATKAVVNLGSQYRLLSADGTLSGVITSIGIRNGGGAILIPYSGTNNCPGVPSLRSPQEGDSLGGTRPFLVINNASDPDPQDVLVYDFQVCSDSQMTSLAASKTNVVGGKDSTFWQVNQDLSQGRWYWWRARSCDGICYSDWSGKRKFYLNIGEIVYGDLNKDGKTNVTDALYLINYLFKGGPSPEPVESGDVNADCKVNVTDAIYLINYLFKSGAAPKPGCST